MTDETARRGRGRPGTPAAERSGYRPPIKAERMAEVRAYAEATGGSVADAVDRLLLVGIKAWRGIQADDNISSSFDHELNDRLHGRA